jgi:hypothetical protein
MGKARRPKTGKKGWKTEDGWFGGSINSPTVLTNRDGRLGVGEG